MFKHTHLLQTIKPTNRLLLKIPDARLRGPSVSIRRDLFHFAAVFQHNSDHFNTDTVKLLAFDHLSFHIMGIMLIFLKSWCINMWYCRRFYHFLARLPSLHEKFARSSFSLMPSDAPLIRKWVELKDKLSALKSMSELQAVMQLIAYYVTVLR